MLALSGIKEEALRKLEKRGEILLELISFVNVRTASILSPGEEVFITHEPYELLSHGVEGIVGEVLSISIGPVRVSFEHIDETEVQRARIRVRFVSYGRIKEVEWIDERPHVELIVFQGSVIV